MNPPRFLDREQMVITYDPCRLCGASERGEAHHRCKRHGVSLFANRSAVQDDTLYWCPVCEIERLEAELASLDSTLDPLRGRWQADEATIVQWAGRLVVEFLAIEDLAKAAQAVRPWVGEGGHHSIGCPAADRDAPCTCGMCERTAFHFAVSRCLSERAGKPHDPTS